MKDQIFHKLNNYFEPSILDVKNDSHLHSNHLQSPKSGNSHFSVKIKSKKLSHISRVDGQRMVYDLLKEELNSGVHALSIKIIY